MTQTNPLVARSAASASLAGLGARTNADRVGSSSFVRRVIGLSLGGLFLAGTALVPAAVSAQALDLGAGPLSIVQPSDFAGFTSISNGQLQLAPNVANPILNLNIPLDDSLGVITLTKVGVRTVILSANSTHSGLTSVTNGLLQMGVVSALSANSTLNVGNTGAVDLNGFNQTVNGLTGTLNGVITNSAAGPVSLIIGGADDYVHNGLITENAGAISLVMNNTGTQTLNNAGSTFTGGVTLNSGTLRVGPDGSLGTGQLTVAGANTVLTTNNLADQISNAILLNENLRLNTPNLVNYTGLISGTGTLIKNGAGEVDISNSGNNFTGGLRLNNGRVRVGASESLGSGTILVENVGGSLGVRGDQTITLSNNITANQFLELAGPGVGNTLNMNGNITATALVELNSAGGEVRFNGANNLVDGLRLVNGDLGVGSAGGLGGGGLIRLSDTSGAVNFYGAYTLDNTFESRRTTEYNTNGFTVELTGELRDRLGDAGGVNKQGAGTLILSGDSIYTGPTIIDAGTLQLDGTIISDVSVSSGAILSGSGSTTGAVVVADGAVLNPGDSPGTMTFGSLVLNPTTTTNFELQTPGVVGMGVNDLIDVTTNLTIDGTFNIIPLPGFAFGDYTLFTYGGALTDNGVDVVSANPDLAFLLTSTANTVDLTIAFAGTVQYWDGAGPAGNSVVDGGGGTWDDGSFNWTNVGGTTNLPWASSSAVFQTIGGDVAVVGPKDVVGLDFQVDGYALTGDALTFTGPGAGPINVADDTASISNNLIAANGLSKTGDGRLVLDGDNSGVSGLTVTGGLVQVGTNTAAGSGAITFGANTALAAGASSLALANDISIDTFFNLFLNNNAFTLDGVISGNSSVVIGNELGVFPVGLDPDATLILTGANTFGGPVFILGSTLQVSADNNLGSASNQVNLLDGQLRSTATFTTARTINLITDGAIDVTDANVLTANGQIADIGALTKNGTGTLVLGNATNSFAGDLRIGNGTVQTATLGALGNGNIEFFDMGGTLALTNAIPTSKTVLLTADGTIATLNGDSTFSGVISGAGALSKTGPAQLTLTGDNSYAGGTNLNEGSLQINAAAAIGTGTLTTQDATTFVVGLAPGANIALANDVVFDTGTTTIELLGGNYSINVTSGVVTTTGSNLTLDGPVSGAGGLATSNFGTITLNGDNSYAGGTSLTSVTAFISTDTALGTGPVTLGDFGSVQNNSGAALSIINDFNIAGVTSTVVGGANDLTIGGAFSGAGELNKAGLGTVTATNAGSSFSGTLNVNQGSFIADGTFGDAAMITNVINGGTLGGSGTIAGTVNVANNATLSPGSSPGTLTIGNLNLNSGSLLAWELGAANTIGGPLNDRVNVTGALTLDGLLTVSQSAGGVFGLGLYNLFSYGTLTDNGVTVNPLPNGLTGFVQNNTTAQQINLIVAAPGTFVQYWDGADQTGNGAIDGGTGAWTTTNTNWTGDAPSEINTTWQPESVGIFQGTAGTVDVNSSAFAFGGLVFDTDGYVLESSEGGSLVTNASSFISTGAGITATINTPIDGAGNILKQGDGTLVLGGTNGYAGGTDLQAGTIELTNSSGLGTGTLMMASGTTLGAGDGGVIVANNVTTLGAGLIASNGFIFTLDGDVAGPGSISHVTAGNLVLNGNNSFTNLGINIGTVTLGSDTAAGIGGIAINNGTTLAANKDVTITNSVITDATGLIASNGFVFTLNGNLGGAGSISHVTGGNLVLNGDNSFGDLGINAGTVTLGSDTAAGTGGIAINNGTTLAANKDVTITNSVITDATGLIASNGFTFTLNGNLGGAGSISHVTGGNLVLNGDNSFGDLGINAGTVTLGSDTAAGTGGIALNNGATLAANTDVTIANSIITDATGLIASNGNVFTLNGNLAGAGSISHVTLGNLVLNGDNSFGDLGINIGTVTLGSNTAAGLGGIALNNGATLAANTDVTIANSIITDATGLIASNGNVFTLNGNLAGAGSISHVSLGNLVLNGNNSFGDLGINAGTVTLGSNTAAGLGGIALNNGATLAANKNVTIANSIITDATGLIASNGFVFTLNGNLAGAGSISHVSLGNLVLNGNNSFGDLGINAGTVTLGSNTAAGLGGIALNNGATLAANKNVTIANSIITDATGLIASNGFVFTLNGNLAGAGSISHVTAGNLVLNGNNSFGDLGINAGTVTLGTNTAGGLGGIALNGGGTLAAGANNLVISNGIITTGAGTVDTGAFTLTLDNVVAGAGSITKRGSGMLVYTRANSYTGATTVAAGDLRVAGSIAASTVTVANGGRLSGTGTVGGLIVQSGGMVAPGNSAVGTLNVAGPVTFQAGSTYAVQVTPTMADRITATGPAALAGTLAFSVAPGLYTLNTSYTLLSASAVTGQFGTVTGLTGFGAAINPLLSYTPTSLTLRLSLGSLANATGTNLTGNSLQVAQAFDRAVAGGFNAIPFLSLYTLQAPALSGALSQLSGEVHSAQRRVAMDDTRVLRETAFDRLNAGLMASSAETAAVTTENGESETTVWLRGVGSWGVAGADAIGSRFTTNQFGVITGVDFTAGAFKVGGAFHHTQNDIEFGSLGTSRVRSTGGTLYAGYRPGSGFAVGVGGSYAGTRASSNRAVTVPGPAQTLNGLTEGSTYQLFGEVAYDFVIGKGAITPFARYAYVNHQSDAFSELGGIAAVSGGEQSYDISVINAGLRGTLQLGDRGSLSGSAGWQNITGDRAPNARMSISGLNQLMSIFAAGMERNAAALEAKANYRVSTNATLGIGYSGVFGNRNSDHGGRATLTVGF